MKKLFNDQPEPEKRLSFGDAPLFNMKVDCNKCPLKEECEYSPNTINCYISLRRHKKIPKKKTETLQDVLIKKKKVSVDSIRDQKEMEKEEKDVIKELEKLAIEEGKE